MMLVIMMPLTQGFDKKTVLGALLGSAGGFWGYLTLCAYQILVGNSSITSYWGLFTVTFLVWLLPSVMAFLGIGGAVMMLMRKHKDAGFVNLINSQILLIMLALFVVVGAFPGGALTSSLETLASMWVGPAVLLISAAVLGISFQTRYNPVRHGSGWLQDE